MAFVEATSDVTARITDGGRAALASMILGEVAFELSSFRVGRGGYVALNPVKVEPVDATLAALLDPVGVSKSFAAIENPIGPNVVAPVCRLSLADTDTEFGLGELGVYATYLVNDTDPILVGEEFLFAAAHFPLISKSPSHTLVWRVLIAL